MANGAVDKQFPAYLGSWAAGIPRTLLDLCVLRLDRHFAPAQQRFANGIVGSMNADWFLAQQLRRRHYFDVQHAATCRMSAMYFTQQRLPWTILWRSQFSGSVVDNEIMPFERLIREALLIAMSVSPPGIEDDQE